MPLPLTELFPDRDYRFHLTLRKGDLGAFFNGRDQRVLLERQRWLESDPHRYVLGAESAAPLVAEAETLLGVDTGRGGIAQRLTRLGGRFEPDIALLAREADGSFRLRAGAVCFPSSWIPAEKYGLTLDEIHGIVPGLNNALAPAIGQFLDRLRPRVPFERANWGLAATPELNMHPALGRPRLGPELDVTQTWVRIEDQILAALPGVGGVLFGIGVRVVPLAELLADQGLRAGLARALATMPDELAAYKGLAAVRPALLRLIG